MRRLVCERERGSAGMLFLFLPQRVGDVRAGVGDVRAGVQAKYLWRAAVWCVSFIRGVHEACRFYPTRRMDSHHGDSRSRAYDACDRGIELIDYGGAASEERVACVRQNSRGSHSALTISALLGVYRGVPADVWIIPATQEEFFA
jgi:hypothetical protein